ncbi:MAG: pyruvate phosphate dikinase [Candidatus Saccharibacteria bacterium]|nr:pyruvate phosphate dikinase [Candidatus Saccharibacteria bacterium]
MVTVKKSKSSAKRGVRNQVVFAFNEGAPETRTAAVRGGKGAYLAEMVALGLPVPPGFTVTTTVARAFRETGQLPKRFVGQLQRELQRLERQTGKEFGNPDNPLLVSVRSGAQASMPGMMDTVLNVGLNPATVAGLARLQGEQFALDAYCRFLKQFGAVVLDVPVPQLEYVINSTKAKAGVELGEVLSIQTLSETCERLRLAIEFNTMAPVPDDPHMQLHLSLEAVMRSWMSERARVYRRANQLPEWWGTAANIQAMVFGNRSDTSGTGVVFSHDVTTGHSGLYGEFLPNAQGEDVVAGVRTPYSIAQMAEWAPAAYQDLEELVRQLSDHLGDIVDVEFTVEDGALYLLQVRRAKRSALAAVTFAVHQTWAGRHNRETAVSSVSLQDVKRLESPALDTTDQTPLLTGLAASPGGAVGRITTSSADAQALAAQGEKVILVVRDTSPDDYEGMICSVGLVTGNGGASCHAAIVARELGLPAVVGVGETLLTQLWAGDQVSIDGTAGAVYDGSLSLISTSLTKEANIFLTWNKRFGAYKPRIGFEWCDTRQDVNVWLHDFYLSDAMATASVGTALEAQASTLRTSVHKDAAEMLVAYLANAVASELRNGFNNYEGANFNQFKSMVTRYGIAYHEYRAPAQIPAMRFLKENGIVGQIEYFSQAGDIFSWSGWYGGYGGEAWAKIARAAHKFISGTWSPTLFVDHVFDLRHNGGRLFDKHAMVSVLTNDPWVQQQLEIKKHTTKISDLYQDLYKYGTPSDQVLVTYAEGKRLGIW